MKTKKHLSGPEEKTKKNKRTSLINHKKILYINFTIRFAFVLKVKLASIYYIRFYTWFRGLGMKMV